MNIWIHSGNRWFYAGAACFLLAVILQMLVCIAGTWWLYRAVMQMGVLAQVGLGSGCGWLSMQAYQNAIDYHHHIRSSEYVAASVPPSGHVLPAPPIILASMACTAAEAS